MKNKSNLKVWIGSMIFATILAIITLSDNNPDTSGYRFRLIVTIIMFFVVGIWVLIRKLLKMKPRIRDKKETNSNEWDWKVPK